MSINHIDSNVRMSQAVVHRGTVYLAGQVANDASVGMREQTQQILDNIDALLERAGSSRDALLSATIWVTDMADFADMNAAWDAWVADRHPPVRACVEAKLAKPEWKVEIMVIAALQEA